MADDLAVDSDKESETSRLENKEIAKSVEDSSKQLSSDAKNYSIQSFIQGNLAIPHNLKENVNAIKDSRSLDDFSKDFKNTEELRDQYSSKMTYMIGKTVDEYGKNISETFSKGHQEIKKIPQSMVILSQHFGPFVIICKLFL